jgi:hypothetical protein
MADGSHAEYIMLATLAGFVLVFFLYSYALFRFSVRLKRFENDTWLRLGSPMIGLRYRATSTNVLKFLSTKQYSRLHDGMAIYLGDRPCFLQRVLFGYVALAVVVVGSIILFVKP